MTSKTQTDKSCYTPQTDVSLLGYSYSLYNTHPAKPEGHYGNRPDWVIIGEQLALLLQSCLGSVMWIAIMANCMYVYVYQVLGDCCLLCATLFGMKCVV